MSARKARAAAAAEVAIFNPAPYARNGLVQVPWDDVAAISPDLTPDSVEVVFRGEVVPSQVDDVEKSASSIVLTFWLPVVPGGDEHYGKATASAVVRRRSSAAAHPIRQGADDTGGGVRLFSDVLDVWFTTNPQPWNDDRKWFGGAASTVQVRKREFLDVNAGFAWVGHDREKRAMQVDRIRIGRPPWDDYEPSYCDFPQYDQAFELVAFGTGPVRAWATMRSQDAFRFEFRDLTGTERSAYNCRLYRFISLLPDADYVTEELYVKATPDGFRGDPATLAFSARYFMSAHLGLLPLFRQVPHIPDWFGIGSDMPPYPGYGFATDAHISSFANPPLFYPRPEAEAHKGFEWETGTAQRVRSLHVFRLNVTPDDIADAAGKAWYLNLLKPLRVQVTGGWSGRGAQ